MFKKNAILVFVPLAVAIALAAGFYFGSQFRTQTVLPTKSYFSGGTESHKIEQILDYIDREYVDTVSRKEIIDKTIEYILQELDPHSYYINADDLAEMNEPLLGNFDGIGVQFNIQSDTVVVINTVAGGPSEKLGIMAGDRIVKVNDSLIAGTGIRNNDVLALLKGQKGTKVKVSVYRTSEPDFLDFTIVRDKIPIHSIDASFMLNEQVALIKLSRFAKTSYDEFVEAMQNLQAQGAKSLILDLRGNGGGFLETAVQIADEMLPKGEMIVYTEGKARPREFYRSTSKSRYKDIEIVVLIDERSASASEIIAGAIQDNDRGTIIGRRSFGKGLVQEQQVWPDGSATRLTIARYYTPTGRCIQKPYQPGKTDDYSRDLYERYEHGELMYEDSIAVDDSTTYITPKGKILYGGGGIVPDVFIAVDTTRYSLFFNQLYYTGFIYEWSFKYTDSNREKLGTYGSWKKFDARFRFTPIEIEAFYEAAVEFGISNDKAGFESDKNKIVKLMKAHVARNMWNTEAYYGLQLKEDKAVEKALDVLKN
jgi:carboxyl-terminal processing protease